MREWKLRRVVKVIVSVFAVSQYVLIGVINGMHKNNKELNFKF